MKFLEKFVEKPNNFFKFLFWNFFMGYLPFGLLVAVFSLFGKVSFDLNNKEVYGMVGLISYLLFIPVIAFILALVCWIYLSIGNFIIKNIIKK